MTHIHPMLVAGSGHTRATTEKTVTSLFAALDPYVIPMADDVTSTVEIGDTGRFQLKTWLRLG